MRVISAVHRIKSCSKSSEKTPVLTKLYRIVASLVRARPLEFFWNILRWLLVAIPATWTNSWLSYIQNKLAIAYRTRLTKEVMKQYLGEGAEGAEGKVYYKLCLCPQPLRLISVVLKFVIQQT